MSQGMRSLVFTVFHPKLRLAASGPKRKFQVRSPTQTIVNWQAPQATYPARGKVIIAGTDTFCSAIPSSMLQVELSASGQLANGRWQASGSAAGVQVGRLAQVPPALQAPLSGTFKLSGTTESFKRKLFVLLVQDA